MGRNLDELKEALNNVANKTVEGKTKGEVLEHFNLQYEDVALTVAVVDSEGDAIATPTVALKTGATAGSGDAVTAGEDGKYAVKYGAYNISVSKTGYKTFTAVVNIDYNAARKGSAVVTVPLALAE